MQKGKKVAWGNFNAKRILIVVAISVIPLFGVGLSLYQVHAQFSGHRSNGLITGNVSLPQNAPMLEIHVANDGVTLLRGARVISVSRDIIRVITTWDSADFTWEVQTKFFTKFLTSKGEKETLADVHVGDRVAVTGKLIKGGVEPIIDADFVRE